VLYVGTFGKIAFPALRLGYLVLPKRLVQAFSQAKALAVRHSEVGSQCVMAQFMAQGHFQRHIRRMRRAALARRNVLKAGWPVDVPGLGAMPEVAAGLHVKWLWITLRGNKSWLPGPRRWGGGQSVE
jgi:GntR family transcriptional regulator/MocR family aminotransferase